MTNEELNKWAHEFLGFCVHENSKVIVSSAPVQFIRTCSKCGRFAKEEMFWQNQDYCSNLNLVAKVEEHIFHRDIEKEWMGYLESLEKSLEIDIAGDGYANYEYNSVSDRDMACTILKAVTATAEQRIRACYQTMKDAE